MFSELDPERRSHLVRRIAELPQAFVTTTTPDDLDPALLAIAHGWEVRAGRRRAPSSERPTHAPVDREPRVTTPRRRPMRRIGDLIPDAARALGLEDELRLARAIATFEAIVAERVPAAAGACRVVRLEGFAIDVEADAPIVAQELRLRSGELLTAFAAAPGGIGDPGPSGPRSPREVPAYNPPDLPAISGRTSSRSGHGSSRRLTKPYREARMAARLQLKLGIVAEHDRLDDSPDTLVVVEPSVGSVARSKGNLYLLVTSRTSSRHALEATRLAAETIRNEYYYDESAGIRVCLQKAIATANKRLLHQADRLGLKSPDDNGPIGVGVGVVRGNEMYVATVGPGRGVPHPPGPALDAARSASRTWPAVERPRAGGLARRGDGR